MVNGRIKKQNHFQTRSKTSKRKLDATLRLERLESRQLLAVVTSLADSGPGTLREALAGADPTITFAVSGTINITTQLNVTRNVIIDGAGQNVTVNNTETTAINSRVFNVDDGTATVLDVTIRNLTISGGRVIDGSASTTGGGIRVNNELLTVENSIIRDNFALSGGGIGLLGTARLTITNSQLRNNAGRSNGGAINVPAAGMATITGCTIENNSIGLESTLTTLAIGGGVQGFGTVVIRDSIVRNNVASTPNAASPLGYGGGIGISTGGNLTVERTQITGNMSDRGGGISTRRSPVVIRDSVVSGNTSADNGGGIRMMRSSTANSTVTIENSTFANNVGEGGGGIAGGVYNGSEVVLSSLTLTGSTVNNNHSLFDGGGIEIFGTDGLLENVTVSGNTADNEGGGVWSSFSAVFTGTANINFATVTGNVAMQNGGGLFVGEPSTTTRNSILSGNNAQSMYGRDLYDAGYLYGTSSVVAHTLVADNSGHLLMNGVMGNIIGTPANLGALGANGGATATHLLMPGPGVNGADPASTLAVDQRGFGRPGANSMRDMGAVESDGTSPTLNLDFNNDGQYNCADMDLLETAIDAGMPVAMFDVNGDNVLTSADVFAWLMDAGELRFGPGRFFKSGDANLDGTVDGSDFGIWNSNKFTPARRWCQGDFNQDNFVDGSDFGLWNANKFTSSDARRNADIGTDFLSRANWIRQVKDGRGIGPQSQLDEAPDGPDETGHSSLRVNAVAEIARPKQLGPGWTARVNSLEPVASARNLADVPTMAQVAFQRTGSLESHRPLPQSNSIRDKVFGELKELFASNLS